MGNFVLYLYLTDSNTFVIVTVFLFQELDMEGCPKPIVFILHNFLSAKIHRLGLYA